MIEFRHAPSTSVFIAVTSAPGGLRAFKVKFAGRFPAQFRRSPAARPYPIASSSSIIRAITDSPMLQNAESFASSPKGFSSSS
jgi:hypothetical protein